MKKIVLLGVLIIIIVGTIGGMLYIKYNSEKPVLEITGDKEITLSVGNEYTEEGSTATVNKKDISKNIKIDSNLDTKKIGKYEVKYTIKYHKKEYEVTRIVNVVDTTKPVIKLKDNAVVINQGEKYVEPGYKAIDNYDGDITKNVVVKNNININKVGEYKVVYTVNDSSNNSVSVERKVIVKEKPVVKQTDTTQSVVPTKTGTGHGVAILMYHYFYDKTAKNNETINDNYMEIRDFEAQMKYLHDKKYYFPTWKEIADYADGKINLPEKSVVVTCDDGDKSFFNLAIPILNKYNIKATGFIITSYPSAKKIPKYKSDNIIFESHTHDMHRGGCTGGHGGLFRCISHDKGVADLTKSIQVIGNNDVIAYPYGDVTENTLSITKEAGFKVGVTTRYGRAKKGMDRLQLPRVRMSKNISLTGFINSL